ncbi:MAG TPA: DUF1572 family protein [Pyrinomonadaceae bacterium]|nr:DUF1572 family protein [Pyrinomonadaceae bacterium]
MIFNAEIAEDAEFFMLTETLTQLYSRDLDKLKTEIGQYSNEGDLWKTSGEITNSAGNLTLHLIGNLKHFIGAVLGNSGFVRDRDAEFSTGGVARAELLAEIEVADLAVRSTLKKLTDADLANTYPIEVFGHPMTTEFFLVHLATHLNYHLGQINYHRRILAS